MLAIITTCALSITVIFNHQVTDQLWSAGNFLTVHETVNHHEFCWPCHCPIHLDHVAAEWSETALRGTMSMCKRRHVSEHKRVSRYHESEHQCLSVISCGLSKTALQSEEALWPLIILLRQTWMCIFCRGAMEGADSFFWWQYIVSFPANVKQVISFFSPFLFLLNLLG